jgi:hypothetical protein
LVELKESLHDHLADSLAFDLFVSQQVDFLKDLADDPLDGLGRNRPFPASEFQTTANLVGAEGLAAAVLLHDAHVQFRDAFIRRKSLAASLALATPTDAEPVFAGPGVNHLIVIDSAKWTLHETTVTLDKKSKRGCSGQATPSENAAKSNKLT